MGVHILKKPAIRYRTLGDLTNDRCYWATALREDNVDPDIADAELDPVYIPNCFGGANSGPDGCTCEHSLSAKEENWRKKYRSVVRELRLLQSYSKWLQGENQKAGGRPFPQMSETHGWR